MPPPSSLRFKRARSMNSRDPTTIEPTGAASPFDRQKVRLSTPAVSSLTGISSTAAAWKIREPSRCTLMP